MKHCERAERTFRTALIALREECPTTMGYPVRVRRVQRPHDWMGETAFDEKKREFYVFIYMNYRDKYTKRYRRQTYCEVMDTLLHEWAHCMAWTPEHPSLTDHEPAWGLAYSKVYQAIVED